MTRTTQTASTTSTKKSSTEKSKKQVLDKKISNDHGPEKDIEKKKKRRRSPNAPLFVTSISKIHKQECEKDENLQNYHFSSKTKLCLNELAQVEIKALAEHVSETLRLSRKKMRTITPKMIRGAALRVFRNSGAEVVGFIDATMTKYREAHPVKVRAKKPSKSKKGESKSLKNTKETVIDDKVGEDDVPHTGEEEEEIESTEKVAPSQSKSKKRSSRTGRAKKSIKTHKNQ